MAAQGQPQAAPKAWEAGKENAGATGATLPLPHGTATASSGKHAAAAASSGDGGSSKKRTPEEQACTVAGGQGHSPAAKRRRQASPWRVPAPSSPGADSHCQEGDQTAIAQAQHQQHPTADAKNPPTSPSGSQHGTPSCVGSDQQTGAAPAAGAAAQADAVAPEAEQAEAAALPDWCERPVMLAEDVQGDAFSYLPGHPLLALACEGHARLLAKVLCMGGDPDARDSRGYTALHLACRHARLACVRCLLEAGAAQLPDRQGRTPAEHAAVAGHSDVLAMLAHHEAVCATLARQDEGPAAAAAAGGTDGQGE